MSTVGQREILTQKRVIAFFRDALGYAYLGNWQDRVNNRNIETELVIDWLKRQRHDGTGKKTDYVSGVHSCTRDGAFTRAQSQRSVSGSDGCVYASVALASRRAQSRAARA